MVVATRQAAYRIQSTNSRVVFLRSSRLANQSCSEDATVTNGKSFDCPVFCEKRKLVESLSSNQLRAAVAVGDLLQTALFGSLEKAVGRNCLQ
ncbi:MAG: hypothetical protein CMJ62_09460 [Planctomycetaceae bacterium]|nr:hypothetical protein [Planctomycetaceae bacterium]